MHLTTSEEEDINEDDLDYCDSTTPFPTLPPPVCVTPYHTSNLGPSAIFLDSLYWKHKSNSNTTLHTLPGAHQSTTFHYQPTVLPSTMPPWTTLLGSGDCHPFKLWTSNLGCGDCHPYKIMGRSHFTSHGHYFGQALLLNGYSLEWIFSWNGYYIILMKLRHFA